LGELGAASSARLERLKQVAEAHARAEAEGDRVTTLATLAPDPVYELHPCGLRMRGMEMARRYYDYYFELFMPRVEGFELLAEWAGQDGVAQEYALAIRPGQEPDSVGGRFRVIGILFGNEDGSLLAGERLYGDPVFLRELLGHALYDELEPIPR